MMEKKILTREMMNSGKDYKELGFCVADQYLPWAECEDCAMELISRITVPDEDGVFYWSYRKEAEELFAQVKYLTDIDTDAWETDEDRVAIADFAFKSGLYDDLQKISHLGWYSIEGILYHLYEALKAKHEHTSSLSYKIGKAFESFLNEKDLIKAISENREVSEKMIEMIGVYREAKEKEKPTGGLPLNMFAKK